MVTQGQRSECLICSRPFRGRADGQPYCYEHKRLVDKEVSKTKTRSNQRRGAFKYAFYKGNLLGFFRQGHGSYRSEHLGLFDNPPSWVPKSRLYNLDQYVPNLDRHQIRKIKAAFAQFIRG